MTLRLKFKAAECNAKFMALYLQGCTIPNAGSYERHMKYLKTVKIAVPPLVEQVKVVAKVEKLEAEIALAEQQIAAAASAKSAIVERFLK